MLRCTSGSPKTHGHYKGKKPSPTLKTWMNMLERCYLASSASYKYYGAQGIEVVDEWHIFTNFLEDMGERPHNMTIDRIDNTKNYSKENCKWATRKEQERNKSTTKFISYKGEKYVCSEFDEIYKLRAGTSARWLTRGRKNIEEALEKYFKDARSKPR